MPSLTNYGGSLDRPLAAFALLALAPLLVGLAAVVRAESRGPALYRATRVGRGGAVFSLYKFRTMVEGAAKIGPGITVADDPRVTRVGRVLRRTKLDELPQLLNVLRGEMAIVGPRPEDPRYVDRYTGAQRRILEFAPGLTSPASLEYRHEQVLLDGADWEVVYVGRVLPAKIALDLSYFERRSPGSDLRVVVRTLAALLQR